MPQLEGLCVRNKRSCKTQLRPGAVKHTNYVAENRATMGRVLWGGLEGWKPVPNLRWFTPQDGSPRSTSRAFPQSPEGTPPFYGSLNPQVLLYPLFPSQTPSTRCGLEESCVHPRAPRAPDLVPADLRRVLHHLLHQVQHGVRLQGAQRTDQIHEGQLGRAGRRNNLPRRGPFLE